VAQWGKARDCHAGCVSWRHVIGATRRHDDAGPRPYTWRNKLKKKSALRQSVGKSARGAHDADGRHGIFSNADRIYVGVANVAVDEIKKLHREILKCVRVNGVYQRHMNASGVVALIALTSRCAMDDWGRSAGQHSQSDRAPH
jgi:hypothetical protein